MPYTFRMPDLFKPMGPDSLLPRDAGAIGPQNEAERQLYELVLAGIYSGPSLKTSIAELTAELRERIRANPSR